MKRTASSASLGDRQDADVAPGTRSLPATPRRIGFSTVEIFEHEAQLDSSKMPSDWCVSAAARATRAHARPPPPPRASPLTRADPAPRRSRAPLGLGRLEEVTLRRIDSWESERCKTDREVRHIALEDRMRALTPLRRVESIDFAEKEAREHAGINSPSPVPTLSLPLPPLLPPCGTSESSPMPERIADPGTNLSDLWCS